VICELELEERDAAKDARHWGAIESTGTLCDEEETSGFDSKKFNTSVCDCSVMSTDSAEVMHPL
jgi:hypothetical protein